MFGAEMLEADNQLIVDEYLAGLIEHEHLVNEAKVWENYETDYRPPSMSPGNTDCASSRPISQGASRPRGPAGNDGARTSVR